MEASPVANLDQILCQRHGDDVLELGWAPLYERWIHSKPDCEDCLAKVRRIPSPDGHIKVLPWVGVPQALGVEQKAGHEAAHAVVGKHRGLVVNSAWVGDDVVEIFGGRSMARGGGVDFEPFAGHLLADVAAMAFAGWAADRVWLKAQGLQGNRAAELAAAASSGIDMDLLFGQNAPMDVYLDAKREADELVREHEREISAVQDELIRHQHLGAEAITAAMDLAHRRTPPAPSNTNKPQTSDDTTTGTPQAAPALAGAGTSTTPNTGGTGMSLIDQARESLGQADEKATHIRGALAQAVLDAEANVVLLSQVSQESQTATEIANTYQQVVEQVQQALQMVQHATDLTEGYAASLHS
ncbi:hypothetical protein [Saccharopolyspora endophytica]|uniref:Chemotaxis protein n=1 Tax=Saccharopolyspora endophytica TaxID=543886 RepID=A0ABS5DE92_9PSEU|nr:hypothetical protein [Saccharopolyspora endophytica]MBQ0924612.1 hypothetical protein [Saccharopolyspora endophytica]